MLDARIYRAALVPVVLALIVCAFSLENRPRAIRTTLAADAFAAPRAEQDLARMVRQFPLRRPGGAADDALARRLAARFRALRSYAVTTVRFTGRTIDGRRRLSTVLARQEGLPGPELVVVAHRDAAARGAAAELSGTAAMLELARVVGGGRLRRTITFASTSGGSGGAAGARDLARRVGGPVDAVLVLGDVAGARMRRPLVVGWSNDGSVAPLQLRRTVEQAVRIEAGTGVGGARAGAQWARLGFPATVSEQGPLLAAGLPAVLLSVSGERPPAPATRVDPARLAGFGRAALRTLSALDQGPDVRAGPQRAIVTLRKVLPGWAVRVLVAALLLPALLATVDAFARVRRRRHPVLPWVGWIVATAVTIALGGLLLVLAALAGALSAAPRGPAPAGAVAVDTGAWLTLVAVALAVVLALVLLRPRLARTLGVDRGLAGEGAGAAVLVAWCALAVVVWAVNPFTALALVPAAHVWLLVAAPDVRIGRSGALALMAVSLAPFALVAVYYASALDTGAAGLAWMLALAVAGGHVGIAAWLGWSFGAACVAAATVLAWRARIPPRPPAPPVTVRGPLTYAGPGSLGGTESALRR